MQNVSPAFLACLKSRKQSAGAAYPGGIVKGQRRYTEISQLLQKKGRTCFPEGGVNTSHSKHPSETKFPLSSHRERADKKGSNCSSTTSLHSAVKSPKSIS